MLGEVLEYHFSYKGSVKNIVATLWDIKSETILQTITEHDDDLALGCDISSNGKWYTTASSDQTVKIWDVE